MEPQHENILRGEIYYVSDTDTNTPVGCEIWSDRPGLVVSNDTTNKSGGTVTVVYLSTSMRKHASPLHVRVTSGGRPAIALCEQMYSVDKSRLLNKIGEATPEQMRQIDKTLCMSLGIDQETYRGVFRKWEKYIQTYHLEVVDEQESIKSSTTDTVVRKLLRQISILTKERDGYRKLAESRGEMLDGVRRDQIL